MSVRHLGKLVGGSHVDWECYSRSVRERTAYAQFATNATNQRGAAPVKPENTSEDASAAGPSQSGGAPRSPVPDWLGPLSAYEPETLRVATGGTVVELLVWGERGLPGLFLLHGAGAHAHWWDGVAPLLAKHYRVAAMTLPGNGRSEWRDRYASADFFEDSRACVAAASLAEAGKPVFIGHSMGGAHLMHGAVYAPEAMRGLVLVDTSFRAPGVGKEPTRRIFASEAEALGRFRLMPPGPAREPILVAHVARHALMQVPGPDGEPGWCWRADPAYWNKFEPGIEQGPYSLPLHPQVPTAHFIAEQSHVAATMATLPLGDDVVRIMLPECGHHVMLDRPLVLVGALRALLAVWP
jgi:pimeloyl-ACP methyl ester carboxylesterase